MLRYGRLRYGLAHPAGGRARGGRYPKHLFGFVSAREASITL